MLGYFRKAAVLGAAVTIATIASYSPLRADELPPPSGLESRVEYVQEMQSEAVSPYLIAGVAVAGIGGSLLYSRIRSRSRSKVSSRYNHRNSYKQPPDSR